MPTAPCTCDWTSIVCFPHWLACLAALLMTAVCVYPILTFVRRGWHIKRDEVLASMTDEAKQIYLQTFMKQDSKAPAHDFDEMYSHRYGRSRLIIPVLILVGVVLPLSFLIAETALARLLVAESGSLHPLVQDKAVGCVILLPGRAVAAIIGAYLWIAYALIGGAVLNYLPPALVLSSALRMIAAAPLGYAIGAMAAPGFGTFLAFAIGVFPLQTVQVILQRFANKQFGLEIGSNLRPDQVRNLDGVDPPVADRLQEADITTVAQLAYCDPVQLSLRTNLRFDAVIDLVDQSLARIYLGTKLDTLMPFGLRGAMEIRHLTDDLRSSDPAKSTPAQVAMAAAAAAVGVPQGGLERAFDEIAHDPYADFLFKVWA